MVESRKLSKDLLTEILSSLSLKSVKRLRCISKLWCALIESHSFIDSHLHKHHINGRVLLIKRHLSPHIKIRPGRALKPRHTGGHDMFSFYDLNVQELENELWPILAIPLVNDLKCEFKDMQWQDGVSVVGPCNGFVCIFWGECFMLCNPILREFKQLPPHSFSCPQGYFFNNAGVGFGVSNNNIDEYKVVLIGSIGTEYCNPDRICTTILLYKSQTNSWRQIDDDPIVTLRTLCCSRSGFLFHGVCHWNSQITVHAESDEDDQTFLQTNFDNVLTFNISTEVFGMLPYLDSMEVAYGKKPSLMVQNGCLALAQYNYGTKSTEIWVMKEYGVEESWTKQFQVGPIRTRVRRIPTLDVVSYLCMKHDDCLLVESKQGRLAYYDFNTNDKEMLYIYGDEFTMEAFIYDTSIISVNHVIKSGPLIKA